MWGMIQEETSIGVTQFGTVIARKNMTKKVEWTLSINFVIKKEAILSSSHTWKLSHGVLVSQKYFIDWGCEPDILCLSLNLVHLFRMSPSTEKITRNQLSFIIHAKSIEKAH